MSILKSKRLWWLVPFAMFLLIWAVYSSQSAVAQHTPGQLYAVSMDIRAAGDDTVRARDGCAESYKGKKNHSVFTKFGGLEPTITLSSGVTLGGASMHLRVDKDDPSSGQLQLFFGTDAREAFSTGDISVTITSMGDSFTVVPDAIADVDPNRPGIQVEVSRDNKKKKGQGGPEMVGQITGGTASFNPAFTCDPNG